MEAKLITIVDYCKYSQVEAEFIAMLKGEDLIEIFVVSGEECIAIDQMPLLEQYARWYYEMQINLEGIDALRHMLERVRHLQNSINMLENKLRLYE